VVGQRLRLRMSFNVPFTCWNALAQQVGRLSSYRIQFFLQFIEGFKCRVAQNREVRLGEFLRIRAINKQKIF